jgi:hypothetical protein
MVAGFNIPSIAHTIAVDPLALRLREPRVALLYSPATPPLRLPTQATIDALQAGEWRSEAPAPLRGAGSPPSAPSTKEAQSNGTSSTPSAHPRAEHNGCLSNHRSSRSSPPKLASPVRRRAQPVGAPNWVEGRELPEEMRHPNYATTPGSEVAVPIVDGPIVQGGIGRFGAGPGGDERPFVQQLAMDRAKGQQLAAADGGDWGLAAAFGSGSASPDSIGASATSHGPPAMQSLPGHVLVELKTSSTIPLLG